MIATRIFIVEDETILLCDLEDIVIHLGYGLAGSATSLDEAMDKLKDGQKPDIALLDLNPVSYTHLRGPRDQRGSRMPSSA